MCDNNPPALQMNPEQVFELGSRPSCNMMTEIQQETEARETVMAKEEGLEPWIYWAYIYMYIACRGRETLCQ